jgi:hypothetical protein
MGVELCYSCCFTVRGMVFENRILGRIFRSYRPWRPLGLRDLEAPTFSDIRLADGGKPYAPAAFYLQEDSWHSFLSEAESTTGP